MFLISVFVCLSIASIVNFWHTRKKRALITNIKGPFTFPLMGSAQKLALLTPRNFLQKRTEYLEKFGTVTRCWAFHRLFIFIADDEFATQLLQHPEYLNTGYNMLQPLQGDSVLGSDGEKWEQRRQLISHAFQPQLLKDFVNIFAAESELLVERLRERSDGKTSFDIYPFIVEAVMNVLISSALGMDQRAQQEKTAEYTQAMSDLIKHFTERFLRLSSTNSIIYSVMCPLEKRRQKRLLDTLNRINCEIIAEERAAMARDKKDNTTDTLTKGIYTIDMNTVNEETTATRKHNTMLSVLLASNIGGTPLTDAEVCAEINTGIYLGTLLSSSTLCFALVMIARHPSVQHKLLEELRSVWPEGTRREYTLENLHKLEYLECAIKETMRLYPAQPIVARDLKRNFPYTHSKLGAGELPEGAELYIDVYDLLHQADKFDDPEAFKPERHQSDEGDKSLLSFSMGPRSCLAQKYVMLLMKTIIAELLSTYELMPFGAEMKLEVKIVLTSKNGYQIGLKMR